MKKLQYKSSNGLAEPMPLSDIQNYNRKLEENTKEIRNDIEVSKRTNLLIKILIVTLGISAVVLVLIVIWTIWYVISHDVFNNFIAEFVRAIERR